MELLIAVVVVSMLVSIAVATWIYTAVTIHSSGRIRTLGVEANVDVIDWGVLIPDENRSYIIDVRLTGTTSATLTMDTSDWDPPNASEYMTLSWNYTEFVLESNVWHPIELYLYVSPDIQGIEDFSFDIIIVALSE